MSVVIIHPDARQYMKELQIILYQKNYFSFEAQAQKYVEELILDIETSLPVRAPKKAPPYFERYGKGLYYAKFKKNKRTTWYAFFKIYRTDNELIYQVRYISNNHVIAQYL